MYIGQNSMLMFGNHIYQVKIVCIVLEWLVLDWPLGWPPCFSLELSHSCQELYMGKLVRAITLIPSRYFDDN